MKYSMTITKEHLKNFQLFRNILQIGGESYLIYAGDLPRIRSEGKVEYWKKITEL